MRNILRLGSARSARGGARTNFDPSTYGVDALDNVYGVHGVARLLTSWTGQLVRLRRSTDSVEANFGYNDLTGFLDSSAIGAWLGGATGFVAAIFDQSGNGRDWVQATAANQPQIDLSGAHAVINFDGGDYMRAAGLVGITNAQPAISIVGVHFINTVGGVTYLVHVSGVSTTHRAAIRQFLTGAEATGRPDDGGGLSGSGATAHGSVWGVHIGRFDSANADVFNRWNGATTSQLSWSGGGANFPSSDSATVTLGGTGSGASTSAGSKLSALIFTRDKLSDAEDASLATSLAGLKL